MATKAEFTYTCDICGKVERGFTHPQKWAMNVRVYSGSQQISESMDVCSDCMGRTGNKIEKHFVIPNLFKYFTKLKLWNSPEE